MLAWSALVLLASFTSVSPQSDPAASRGQDTESGVAALSRLLVHPDASVREAAATALRGAGPSVELAFPAVMDAVKAGDAPRATARALIERLGPRAAPLVPELVAWGRSGAPEARDFVVELLGVLTPCVKGAEGFLAETASSGSGKTRDQAARALLILDPTRTQARDLLATAVRGGTIDRDERLAAALGRAGLDAELGKWVVHALDDATLANARFAEEVLAHVDGRSAAAVGALAEGLKAESDDVRASCADALGRIGPGAKGATDGLERMLQRVGTADWFAGARALARIQPSHGATASRLIGAASDPAQDLDDVAIALTEFEPEVAARELNAQFDRGDGKAKLRLLELAAKLVDRSAKQDDGSAASAAEMRAILHGRALAEEAAALLLRSAGAAEPEARARGVTLAAALTGRDAKVDALLMAALADGDAAVRKAALDASAKRSLGLRELAERLGQPAAAGDPAVAQSAATTIGKQIASDPASAVATRPARFSADELIALCVLSNDFELSGFALRDAEIVALIEAAGDQDEVRARLAARALRRNDGPVTAAAGARLVQALASGREALKIAAADLLDQRCAAADAAIPALVAALGETPAVAEAASASLVSHGAAAVPALAKALADESPERRRRAVATLAAMKGAARGAVPQLVDLLSRADPALSAATAKALVAILTDGDLETRLEKLERGR